MQWTCDNLATQNILNSFLPLRTVALVGSFIPILGPHFSFQGAEKDSGSSGSAGNPLPSFSFSKLHSFWNPLLSYDGIINTFWNLRNNLWHLPYALSSLNYHKALEFTLVLLGYWMRRGGGASWGGGSGRVARGKPFKNQDQSLNTQLLDVFSFLGQWRLLVVIFCPCLWE